MKSQNKYKILSKRKYAYFWTIHNKYFPVELLEYPEYISEAIPNSKGKKFITVDRKRLK